MAFCFRCGKELDIGARFCWACGASVTAPSSLQFDQEARTTLLDLYSSLMRYWGTNLLAIVIAFFTAFQAKPYIGAVLVSVALTFLSMQVVYAFLRVVWTGRLSEHALQVSQPVDLKPGEIYIHRLHQKVENESKNERFGNFLYELRLPKFWALATIGPTILASIVIVVLRLLGIISVS